MLRGLIKRKPARLLLGSLSIGSGNLTRQLESLAGTPAQALDRALLISLSDLLPFPKAAVVDKPLATDMAVDVALQDHQSGSAADFSIGGVGLPLYWRPRIRLTARLYHLQSRQPKATFEITQRMPWFTYLNKVFSWRVLVGLEHPACRNDLEHLLRQASERLVTRLRNST